MMSLFFLLSKRNDESVCEREELIQQLKQSRQIDLKLPRTPQWTKSTTSITPRKKGHASRAAQGNRERVRTMSVGPPPKKKRRRRRRTSVRCKAIKT